MEGEGKGESKRQRRYFEVESVREDFRRLQGKEPLRSRLAPLRQLTSRIVDGLSILLGPFIMFGSLAVVLLGVVYGPLAFYGAGLLALAGVGYYVDRKVGRHLVFADYNLKLRVLAFLPAFGLILLIIFGALLISKAIA